MSAKQPIKSIEKKWIIDVLSQRSPEFNKAMDVNVIIDVAVKNGLGAALFQQLNDSKIECPDTLQSELKRAYFTNLVRNTNISNVWKELKEILETKKMRYIPLKGIYLSQYVYKDPTLRAMSDIDVLLTRNDADKAYNYLLKLGATSSEPDYQPDDTTTDHHLPGLTYKGVYIELHRGLFPDDSNYNIDYKDIWNNLVQQRDTVSIHPHLNLIYFCLHLYYTVKRGGLRLSWLYDFIVYSRSEEFTQCKGSFMQQLNAQNCVEPVLAMLYAAEKVFNYQFPFIDRNIYTKNIRSIEKRAIYFANNQGESSTDYGYEIAIERLKNTKGFVNKLSFLKKMVFKPGNSFLSNMQRLGLLTWRTLGMIKQKTVSFFRF